MSMGSNWYNYFKESHFSKDVIYLFIYLMEREHVQGQQQAKREGETGFPSEPEPNAGLYPRVRTLGL